MGLQLLAHDLSNHDRIRQSDHGHQEKKAVENGKDYKVNGQQYYYYDYDLTWVTASGDTRDLGYETKQAPDGPMPYAQGQYLTAKISQKRVVAGPSLIDAAKLPASVKAKLN